MKDLHTYFRPESPAEAVALKQRYGTRAAYLGGGTDLMVHRPAGVEAVIDIRHCGLGSVRREDGGVTIGGAALLRTVELEAGWAGGGMLREAVRETAPWLIRNAATLAGNSANASPAADSVPALLALDAQLTLLGGGEEAISLEDALVGPHHTALGDRLIVEIRIGREAAERRGAFIKHSRSKSDIAQVNIAVAARPDGGVLRDVRIALGAVAPTAMRARSAEAVLEGRRPTPDVLERAAGAVLDEVRPIDDWRASADYRRRVSAVLMRRAVQSVVQSMGEGAA